mgnify:FL=1|tara:strand:+ start:180 stop:1061 length:882 start_codon:yes stop_codon:yes gene_type:complete
MNVHVFPGQGSQFAGMGKDLYENSSIAKEMFHQANEILGFSITEIMFGTCEDALKQTRVTQPAIFLHSVILSKVLKNSSKPELVAGHSLGEFSALVAANYLSFTDGLNLVAKRAEAMQKACEKTPSTMAAVLGIENEIVENICSNIEEIVVPANYNCPGQLVISGSNEGIEIACQQLKDAGAKRVLKLPVGGAFHSPIMKPAQAELEYVINNTNFTEGICPIYQNVTAKANANTNEIKENLKKQLTYPVLWTQTMAQMMLDGISKVTEVGPGKVLQGLFKKIDRELLTESAGL